MFGKQNSTFWSAHIQQQIHKTSRLKAVKLKVLRVLQVVIKKKKSQDNSEMLEKKKII